MECLECGHKFKKLIRQIRANPKFSCPKCGKRFDATSFLSAIADADRAVDDLAGEADLKRRRN
jgi:predicted nucleic acid-binding Zn ribbon protein